MAPSKTPAQQLAATAAHSTGPAVFAGHFYRPNLVDELWQDAEALDLVASGLGQLPRYWQQATLRDIEAAERQLAAGIEDLLAPFNNSCALCSAQPGEPCTPDCYAEQSRLNDLDDGVACDDCGALTGQRCRTRCPRFADL